MLKIEKYQEPKTDLTYSEEGFWGGLAGFITGAALSSLPFASAGVSAGAEARLQKLRQDVKIISDRIAKIRNGEIEEAAKHGKNLPAEVVKVDGERIIMSAIVGTFYGPWYGMVAGSKLQDEYKKLQEKLAELEREMEKAGIEPKAVSTESYSGESINLKENEIEEVVLKIVSEFAGVKVSDIAVTDKLEDDLGLDKLDIVELGMELSERFKIEDNDVWEESIKNAKTVNRLIKIVSNHIKKHKKK